MKRTIDDLIAVIKRLRAPDGCPWDREQTHESLRTSLLEEAYEAADAIDEGDDNKTMDELGDVLLQVVMHAEIASEEGKYDFTDITDNICEKMIRRHEHVFGEISLDKTAEVLVNWDRIKSKEKGFCSYSDSLRDVPRAFPALFRTQKLLKRAKKAGFTMKTDGEITEQIRAVADDLSEEVTKEKIGKILFLASALASEYGVDAEDALYKENDAFVARFSKMEADSDKDLGTLSQSEVAFLWKNT